MAIQIETKRRLIADFLPELHQTRWAEQRAQLHEKLQMAEALPTTVRAAAVAAVQGEIKEHYKRRHDVEQTRRELETS